MAGTKELQGVQQLMDAQSITGAEPPPVAPPPSSNNSGGDPSVASWLGHQMGYLMKYGRGFGYPRTVQGTVLLY